MKQVITVCFIMAMILSNLSCDSQVSNKQVTTKAGSTKVDVYYFHFSRRCTTCESVEKNAKLAMESLYGPKVKSGDYTFKGINLDEESSSTLAKKLGVGGQALLVVSGDNKVDITNQGFLNAQDLEKMKKEIKKAVETVTVGS